MVAGVVLTPATAVMARSSEKAVGDVVVSTRAAGTTLELHFEPAAALEVARAILDGVEEAVGDLEAGRCRRIR